MEKPPTVLYKEEEINRRINELAQQITTDYRGKELLLIGILKGSIVLIADLLRALHKKGLTDADIDFVKIASYGQSKKSNKNPTLLLDIAQDISGKDVLVVEDIIDTGYTLSFLRNLLLQRNPLSLKILTFLDKKEKREVEVPVDYTGFQLKGTPWVEGYGLDGGAFGRGRPEIITKES
ncbi:MAG: hypoxanthine phosphoribosyltransferase [Candidatus Levybacteria bacterium]|nr:hypoxanthine phosphoribosyltransferase [Candidatus Levybacteria bacterium]